MSLENRLIVSYETHPPHDPDISFLGIYPKEMETYFQTKTHTQMFIEASLITAPNWKQHKCPSTGDAYISIQWNAQQ